MQKTEKKKILVVNDERFWLGYLELLFRERGLKAELSFANNGKEAIAKYSEREEYNAILMNIQMPVMDGLEATRELRKLGCRRPILAWTAHEPAIWTKRCLEAGMDYFYELSETDIALDALDWIIGGVETGIRLRLSIAKTIQR